MNTRSQLSEKKDEKKKRVEGVEARLGPKSRRAEVNLRPRVVIHTGRSQGRNPKSQRGRDIVQRRETEFRRQMKI